MDVTAISTYPSFAFATADAIPKNYYSQLRAFTDRPIVIAEAGYSSAAGAQGINNGTEDDQAAYVRRLLDETQSLNMPFVIWFAGWDPAYAQDTPFSVFQHIGLRRDDDSEKPAWTPWREAAQRPYQPPSG
jgi:exo-beta-1,3-glucanase (GH17 family)